MAKINSFTAIDFLSSCSSSPSCYITAKQFTLWMKSLVMQGNGCTVFSEVGEIVYRVDNYDKKSSNQVYLMDLKGKVLFTIIRRKLCLFKQWKGYKCDDSEVKSLKPFFQVKRKCRLFGKNKSCQVSVQSNNGLACCYTLESCAGKSSFKVVNNRGELVAEAKRKELCSGVKLGDDVLNLVVEPHVDHSLIMALAVVYGLMHNRL